FEFRLRIPQGRRLIAGAEVEAFVVAEVAWIHDVGRVRVGTPDAGRGGGGDHQLRADPAIAVEHGAAQKVGADRAAHALRRPVQDQPADRVRLALLLQGEV